MKVELAIAGIILAALIGYLIGAMIEHPPWAGGFQVLGAVLGAMVAVAVLTLGEALKDREKS